MSKVDQLRKKVSGTVSVSAMPFDVRENLVRQELKKTVSEWRLIDSEHKGQMIATQIIQDHIEFVNRYYSQLETQQKAEAQEKRNGAKGKSKQKSHP